MVAGYTAIERLKLAPDDARAIASRLSDVSKYYSVPVVRPEIFAVGALLFTMGRVYGKMIIDIRSQAVTPTSPAEVTPPMTGAALDPSQNGAPVSNVTELKPWFTGIVSGNA